MSSLTDTLISSADMVNTVLAGVQMIDHVIGTSGTHKAVDTLRIVQAVTAAIRSGLEGKVDAKGVLAELDKLKAGLDSNDRKADSELDQKFPTG